MCNNVNVIHAKISVPYTAIELEPTAIEQSTYDAIIETGAIKANRIYYVVPDGTLSEIVEVTTE